MDDVTKTITKHPGVDPDKSNVDLSLLQILFLLSFIFSNINPFIALCILKGHTYLDKPAALSCSFG